MSSLSDGPIDEPINVYKNSEWSRIFSFMDRDTRQVKDLTDISFYGSVTLDGVPVASFVFVKLPDDEFSVTLPVSAINSLDASKCYGYDWFLVENNIPEVFAKSKLKKFDTGTVIP